MNNKRYNNDFYTFFLYGRIKDGPETTAKGNMRRTPPHGTKHIRNQRRHHRDKEKPGRNQGIHNPKKGGKRDNPIYCPTKRHTMGQSKKLGNANNSSIRNTSKHIQYGEIDDF